MSMKRLGLEIQGGTCRNSNSTSISNSGRSSSTTITSKSSSIGAVMAAVGKVGNSRGSSTVAIKVV